VRYTDDEGNLNTRTLFLGGSALVLFILLLIFSGKFFQNVDADEVSCIQSPVSGKLSWYVTPGVKWQGFGKVTQYYKLDTYEFKVPIRFNDGGHGTIVGSLNYELPLDIDHLTQLHIKYGSQEAIQKQLIETVTDKCVYMTGPLMSSKESYAEKRTSLIRYVEDQIMNGVYKTTQKEVRMKDPMTGQDKTVTVVEIVNSESGFARQEEAVLSGYGIKVTNFAVKGLPYDEAIEKQIKQQQDLIMQVQTAIASAKEAEQRSITVAKEGEANAAKAKWEQEVIKAQKVTEAQQKLEVAGLDAQAASAEKRANILRGEGEAERKRLVMNADGALDKKLEALVKINELYATAIKEYKGNWVPTVQMGKEGNTGGGATALVDLLTAKTARDLGVSLDVKGEGNTK
jgi:hypothetical protein